MALRFFAAVPFAGFAAGDELTDLNDTAVRRFLRRGLVYVVDSEQGGAGGDAEGPIQQGSRTLYSLKAATPANNAGFVYVDSAPGVKGIPRPAPSTAFVEWTATGYCIATKESATFKGSFLHVVNAAGVGQHKNRTSQRVALTDGGFTFSIDFYAAPEEIGSVRAEHGDHAIVIRVSGDGSEAQSAMSWTIELFLSQADPNV